MKSKTYPIRATAVAAVLALVAGCAGAVPSSTTSAPTAGSTVAPGSKQYTIAFVPGMTAHPFYATMHQGAKDAAPGLGITLVWQGAHDWSVEAQTPILDSLLAQKPDALIVVPTDSKGMINEIKKFVDAKIPVFTVDTNIDDASLLVSNVTGDNTLGGKQAADAIAEAVGGKGKVAVIATTPGNSTAIMRRDGFLEQMKSKYPNITVVASEFGGEDPTNAQRVAEAIMLKNPDLVGIFGTNGFMATGAANAVGAANKQDTVWVAGYDADPALVDLLKKQSVKIIVSQQPAEMAKIALGFAKDYLDGKRDAIQPNVLVPNVVITSANINDSAVQKFLYLPAE